MAEETLDKAILGFLGMPPEIDSLDKFKEKFNSDFVKQDPQAIADNKPLFAKVTGIYNGTNKGLLKRTLKESGIDITGEDFDTPHLGDVMATILPKVFKNLTSEISALKESAGKGTNEKIAAIQEEYNKFKTEVSPKVAEYDKLKGEYEGFKTTAAKEKADFIRGIKEDEELKKVPFSQSAGPIARNGFRTHVLSKHGRVVGDDGQLYTTDKDGNKIPDPEKAGSYKLFSKTIKEEMDEVGKTDKIFAVTDNGGQGGGQRRTATTFTVTEKNKENGGAQEGRKLNTSTRKVAA